MSFAIRPSFRIERDSYLDFLTSDVAYIKDLHSPAPFVLSQLDTSLPNSLVLTAGTNITLNTVGTNLVVNSTGGGSALPGQIVYVRQNGNDITGNGTIISPYATITYAMSTITDAAWEKRYIIDIGPGNWPDNFSWKAWVFAQGHVTQTTRLTGTIDINDPSWSIAGSHFDARAGAEDIAFTGTITLDWSLNPVSPGISYGKFYFFNCNANNTINCIGIHPVNQIIVSEGFLFAGMNITGVQVTTIGISGQGGTFTLNSSPTVCSIIGFGGGNLGNLTLNFTVGNTVSATLIDMPVLGTLTISGASSTVNATNSSLPLQSSIIISGGGILNRLTDAYSLAYTPSVPSQWAGNPTNLSNAVDRLANAVYALRGNVPIS